MHRQTMKLESVDASTDSKTRVCGCIHRLYIQSRSMHPPTLCTESVDASTDSRTRVGGCIHRPMKYGLSYRLWIHRQTMKLESADASTDSKTRVCGCIHRLYIQSRSMHPPTLYRVGRCIHEIWLIMPTVH